MPSLNANAGRFRLSLDSTSDFQRGVAKDLAGGDVYEPGTWRLLEELIEPFGGDVIDVGAHVGILSCHMATLLQRPGGLYAFEPDPANRKRLRANLRLNDIEAHVSDKVVCDRDGPVMFFTCVDSDGGHAIWNPARAPANWRTRRKSLRGFQRIATGVRIDHLKLSPQLIKIDVEGGEMSVLSGAMETIARARPVVILEINAFGLHQLGKDENDVRQFFRDRGYTEYGVIDEAPWRKPLKPEETMQQEIPQKDGLFLPVFNMLFLP